MSARAFSVAFWPHPGDFRWGNSLRNLQAPITGQFESVHMCNTPIIMSTHSNVLSSPESEH